MKHREPGEDLMSRENNQKPCTIPAFSVIENREGIYGIIYKMEVMFDIIDPRGCAQGVPYSFLTKLNAKYFESILKQLHMD